MLLVGVDMALGWTLFASQKAASQQIAAIFAFMELQAKDYLLGQCECIESRQGWWQ